MPGGAGQETGDAARACVLARWVLVAYLVTFAAARSLVYLIMSRRVPDLYVHLGGTHVHHLNFGIVLLSVVGAILLLCPPRRSGRRAIAVAYGIGLGLTFDEFGMWLHLGGGYWQRASFDAVAVIAGLLALIAVAPKLRDFRPRTWSTAALVAIALTAFTWLLVDSFRYVDRHIGPRLQQLDAAGPR